MSSSSKGMAPLTTDSDQIHKGLHLFLMGSSGTIMLIYAAIESWLGYTKIASFTLACAVGSFLMILLYQLGWPTISKAVYNFIAIFVISIGVDWGGTDSQIQLFYIPAMALPFIFHSMKKWWIPVGMSLMGFIVCTLQLYLGSHLYFESIPTGTPEIVTLASPTLAGIFTLGVVVFFYVQNQRYLDKIIEQQSAIMMSSKMADLGTMAGGVAHEINNPLAIINGHLHHIRSIKGLSEEEQVKFNKSVQKIENMVIRISKIVRALLNFSRDGTQDPFQVVKVQDLLDEVSSFTESKLSKSGIELRKQIHDLDTSIRCQPVQMSQVLLNLITNAADAIAQLDKKWIQIECANMGSFVEIRITDSGFGIPLDIQDKIMQPFFTTKAIGQGTGLGLSIAKGIIDSHEGELIINNNCPNTQFVIRLPRSQPMIDTVVRTNQSAS